MQEVRVVTIINKRMKGRISIVFIREKCYYNKVKGDETSGSDHCIIRQKNIKQHLKKDEGEERPTFSTGLLSPFYLCKKVFSGC